MEIRRLRPGDEARVHAAAALFDDPPDEEAAHEFLADPGGYLLIAYLAEEPAGFLRAHELPQLKTTRRQMFLYEIGVAPSHRRQGVGRALIGELERICRERDFEEMFVISNEANVPAMRLYEATGGQRETTDDVVLVYPFLTEASGAGGKEDALRVIVSASLPGARGGDGEQKLTLRKLPVDLSEFDEIASESEDLLYSEHARTGYVDTQTGAVHIIYRDAFRRLEEEEKDDELSEWAEQDLEVAAAILEDNEGRFEPIDRWESSQEYRLMEEFAERTQTPRLRNELFQALQGAKPFRNFRHILSNWTKAREAWFAFQEQTHREWARVWLNDLGIDPIDTSPRPPDPVPSKW